ncbi:MAG: elongation factor 4 [Candidatus Moranbacteria bacterium]|nr:elongation factor 4 [Candidatus Moranbacteria bacterium]
MDQEKIRNFCIIAHIDHGKSTLCDRMLEITKTVSSRQLKEQTLDQMELERERGITIKLQPVRMRYNYQGKDWDLNLIDTPGHVDFSYEVSRSLAAVEGAVLLVDATQGIQAQTLANLYLALEQDLSIIPVINKIDLPNAQTQKTQNALKDLLGINKEEIIKVSAKTGENVAKVIEAVIDKVEPPKGDLKAAARALIFDSYYDSYKGVIAYVRMVDGFFNDKESIYIAGTEKKAEILELGIFNPAYIKRNSLQSGEIGYIATGLKEVKDCRVGDTIMNFDRKEQTKSLKGYKKAKPMVYASFYPKDGDQYNLLRDALDRLSLNDASFVYFPESSKALGRGFKGGFLGLLHLEIIQERLRREFNLDLVFTIPSVEYKVEFKKNKLNNEQTKESKEGKFLTITSPSDLPDPSMIQSIREPFVKLEIISISQYVGPIMDLLSKKRSLYKDTSYLDSDRAILIYEIPLQEVITNLHDAIKTVSKGYASINYEFLDFRSSELVRLDILVAQELKEELSRIVPKEKARSIGKEVLKRLKETLPRQNFAVALQAAIGGRIIARENISALKKDVLAKLYGGDRTRKDKLLKKQKKGKDRLKQFAKVEIPANAYIEIMKN